MSDIGSGDEGLPSQSTYTIPAAECPRRVPFPAVSVVRPGLSSPVS